MPTSRHPLGVLPAPHPNAPRGAAQDPKLSSNAKHSSHHHHHVHAPSDLDAKDRLKKAVNDAHEERRKRTEAEGNAEGWKAEVEKLRSDLEKAKAKLSRRDETIRNLSENKPQPSSSGTGELEKKLADLVKMHSASKAKYSGQLETLREENTTLQKSLQTLQSTHTSEASAHASLRREHTLATAEIAILKREVESLRASLRQIRAAEGEERKERREFEEERMGWRLERGKLEREVKRAVEEGERKARSLEKEVESLQEEVQVIGPLVDDNFRLGELLDAATVAYCALHRGTVAKSEHEKLQMRYLSERLEVQKWRSRAEKLDHKIAGQKDEIKDLKERMRSTEKERRMLEGAMAELTADRRSLREDLAATIASLASGSADFSIEPLEAVDARPVLKHTLKHLSLTTHHFVGQINSLISDNAALSAELASTTSSLSTSRATLIETKRELADLRDRHAALESVHAPCEGVRRDLASVRQESEERQQAVDELEEEVRRMEKRLKESGEMVKKANEIVARSKSAKEALEEEVQHLRDAYVAASKYEGLYENLQEEHGMILAREEAAIEEAEHLGRQNAELLGHTNGVQKISYVEGVRREMAQVKQELATTRHLLNTANDRAQILEAEIAAYKGVGEDMGLGIGGSMRTKVVRRQPEGGRLTVSRAGRSVSGPSGRA
ncbi:hypothetical protein IAT38_005782 [Cryptococcus sp. DSM 104549]